MNVPPHIEKRILDGFVLNQRGEWVPVGVLVTEEEKFRAHLEMGEIQIDGRWRPLKQRTEKPDAGDTGMVADSYEQLDTVRVSLSDLPVQRPEDADVEHDNQHIGRRTADRPPSDSSMPGDGVADSQAVREDDPTSRLEIEQASRPAAQRETEMRMSGQRAVPYQSGAAGSGRPPQKQSFPDDFDQWDAARERNKKLLILAASAAGLTAAGVILFQFFL